MACKRYYGVVSRDAGSWVGCWGWGCRSPLPRMQPMHACSSLGVAKVRVTTHNHVCLTFTGRGMPVGRHRADMLRSPAHSQDPLGRPYEPTAQSRDPPPTPNVEEYIVNSAHGRGEVSVARSCAAGQSALSAPKKRGVSQCISPVRSAYAPPPAHPRTCTPSPAYVQTPGGGIRCMHAVCGPHGPCEKCFFVIMRIFFEGVSHFISPPRSACAALTAQLRTRTPSPVYVQTLGCGGTCVHAPWRPQQPFENRVFA
jgi:hypothetical protein